jgi:hypothetical protein
LGSACTEQYQSFGVLLAGNTMGNGERAASMGRGFERGRDSRLGTGGDRPRRAHDSAVCSFLWIHLYVVGQVHFEEN